MVSEVSSPGFTGRLSDAMVAAIRKAAVQGTMADEQPTAMRRHVLLQAKNRSRRTAVRRLVVDRRHEQNPRLGVISFGDNTASLPEEHKLEFPLLSDPNNKVCEHCGAMLWKEETISCCSNGDV